MQEQQILQISHTNYSFITIPYIGVNNITIARCSAQFNIKDSYGLTVKH